MDRNLETFREQICLVTKQANRDSNYGQRLLDLRMFGILGDAARAWDNSKLGLFADISIPW